MFFTIMNRLQTYHHKLKKEDFTEVKSSFFSL